MTDTIHLMLSVEEFQLVLNALGHATTCPRLPCDTEDIYRETAKELQQQSRHAGWLRVSEVLPPVGPDELLGIVNGKVIVVTHPGKTSWDWILHTPDESYSRYVIRLLVAPTHYWPLPPLPKGE